MTSYQKVKNKRLIYVQTIMNVKVLFGGQKADISDISEVSL